MVNLSLRRFIIFLRYMWQTNFDKIRCEFSEVINTPIVTGFFFFSIITGYIVLWALYRFSYEYFYRQTICDCLYHKNKILRNFFINSEFNFAFQFSPLRSSSITVMQFDDAIGMQFNFAQSTFHRELRQILARVNKSSSYVVKYIYI